MMSAALWYLIRHWLECKTWRYSETAFEISNFQWTSTESVLNANCVLWSAIVSRIDLGRAHERYVINDEIWSNSILLFWPSNNTTLLIYMCRVLLLNSWTLTGMCWKVWYMMVHHWWICARASGCKTSPQHETTWLGHVMENKSLDRLKLWSLIDYHVPNK